MALRQTVAVLRFQEETWNWMSCGHTVSDTKLSPTETELLLRFSKSDLLFFTPQLFMSPQILFIKMQKAFRKNPNHPETLKLKLNSDC